MPKPSVGRTVHYVSHGTPGGEFKSECRAAIIAGAPTAGRGRPTTKVELVVLNPTGLFFNTCVQDEDTKAGGTWHWPEIVSDEAPKPVKAAKVAKPAVES